MENPSAVIHSMIRVLGRSGWTVTGFKVPVVPKETLQDMQKHVEILKRCSFETAALGALVAKSGVNQVLADPQHLKTISYIAAQALKVPDCENEDDVKNLIKNVTEANSLLDKVDGQVKSATLEVQKCVDTFDKRRKLEKEKQAKEDETKKRKEDEAKKKKADKEALTRSKQAGSAGTADMPVFNLVSANIKTMLTFPDTAALKEAKVTGDLPYVVEKSPPIDTCMTDSSVKATVGVFRIKFPISPAVCSPEAEKRGQQPFVNSKSSGVREAMLDTCLARGNSVGKPADNVASRMVESVSMSGMAPGCGIRALERQSLGQCRFQLQGQREVLAVSFDTLLEVATKLGADYSGEGFSNYVNKIMDTLMSKDGLRVLGELDAKHKVHHHLQKPGQTMYVPCATAIWERTAGDQFVLGFRTSHLGGTETSVATFADMVNRHRATVVDAEKDAMVAFWDCALLLMQPPSDKKVK